MQTDRPSRSELAAMIDHAVLKPDATDDDVGAACDQAARLQLGCLCVRPIDVALAARQLAGTGVVVGSVAGFPHGTQSTAAKVADTTAAIEAGAEEIDMVCRIAALVEGDTRAAIDDIAAVVAAAAGRVVKVILECCYLRDEQIVAGCKAARSAGAQFVKTSTGFGTDGARVEHVRLMRRTVGEDFGVKAAGGIRTLDDALAMIAAGADRLGTSSGQAILENC